MSVASSCSPHMRTKRGDPAAHRRLAPKHRCQGTGLGSREIDDLLVELHVFQRVDLPVLSDGAVGRARPVQRQLLEVISVGEALKPRLDVFVLGSHALFPQHAEGLSIACGKRQSAQLRHGHFASAQGALEDAFADEALKVRGRPLPERPEPGAGSNQMVGDAHRGDVTRLASASEANSRKAKTPAQTGALRNLAERGTALGWS